MSGLKKIVIVSGNRIAPATTGGQVHSLSIARALVRSGHSVQIFSVTGRREDYGLRNVIHGYIEQPNIEPGLSEEISVGLFYGVLQTVGRRLNFPRVWQHALMRRGLVPKRLRSALQSADVILSDFPYVPRFDGPWRNKPWFLISHNLEYKLLEQGGGWYARYTQWMRDIESSAPGTFTDILACAEEDRDFYRQHDKGGRLALPIVRCGVDPRAYVTTEAMRQSVRAQFNLEEADTVLMFSGSGYPPNVDAYEEIRRFCQAEAEYLARARVHFMVVGSVCPQPSRTGALIVTGRVPEVLPYFAAADAGLNMVRRGSGSNVKIFEYLAARLPVISTVFGARGTPLQSEEDYLPVGTDDLKQVIERFLGQDRRLWRQKAEGVWTRHGRACDIQHLVEDAVRGLPGFTD
jgi:hypothetical protein